MRPWIGDGQDRQFYLLGKPGLYPTCRFRGRVMAYHQTHEVLMAHEEESDRAKKRRIYADAVASRLTGWDYLDEDDLDANGKPKWKPFDDETGNRLEVTGHNAQGLPYDLFNRLRDVVLGLTAADPDPDTHKPAKTPSEDEKN